MSRARNRLALLLGSSRLWQSFYRVTIRGRGDVEVTVKPWARPLVALALLLLGYRRPA